MKVVSKLVDLELHISHVEKRGNQLLVYSDSERSIPTTIHIDKNDVISIAKVLIGSLGFWKFLFTIPLMYLGFRKNEGGSMIQEKNKTESETKKEWDPWE